MKRLFLLLFTIFGIFLHGQGLQVGDTIPDFPLNSLGENTSTLQSKDLRGKVVLLDFWATWCSPCIGAMQHLDELQNQFANELKVVAVSGEDESRLLRFIEKTDHDFRFVRDTGRLGELFPHQVIPHTVLINPAGVVVAITSPENVTAEVLTKVLRNTPIDLPLKADRIDFDPTHDYFQTDTLTRYHFELQPNKPNLPAFTKTYWEGPFLGRRFTSYNMTIEGLYREAYQMSIRRLELEFDEALVDWEQEDNRYCMDIVVDDPAELYTAFKQELSDAFPIQARLEQRTKEVVVVSTLGGEVLAPKGQPTEQFEGRGDGFKSTGATIAKFCDYLEGFGIFGYPVVDETGTSTAFTIDFTFAPEDPSSFKESMTALGLTYRKEKREIEVLVLYLRE